MWGAHLVQVPRKYIGSGKAMTGQQLRQAAHDGDAAKVSTLLSTQGAQSFINYQDALGATPLHFAAQNGHQAVTNQLLAARCNVDLQAKNGCTPLHAAAQSGHASIAKQLLGARCNVDLQTKKKCTPLYYAAQGGHELFTRRASRSSEMSSKFLILCVQVNCR